MKGPDSKEGGASEMAAGRALSPDRFVRIGTVVKAQGIKGEVKIFSYSQQPENFSRYEKLVLVAPQTGVHRQVTINRVRIKDKTVVVALAEITGRDQAEGLRGYEVWLAKTDFPKPAVDEYYWHDLEGARVVTESGDDLGTIQAILDTKAHDILVVSGPDREYLIPVREEIVRDINEQTRTVIVSPVPGLLELNE